MPLNGSSTFGSKHSSPLQSNGVLHVSDPHKQRSPTREDVPQRAFQDQAKESPPCDGALRQHDVSRIHEKDIENMAKDNFQDQMKRELSYREEMVQQLHIVRDTLCSELDQERKARYAIQQKLKEAHDALHHFSCKMLTPRHCTGACTFKPPLLPP
eukprot:XP_014031994.1 PREDICTED: SKI family transcriptional corepressor 1-like isoform X5 [Salmo salar]